MLHIDGIHDDTLALQELLDRRGIVTVERPGTYLVSRTLIIHSNTRLICAPGVHCFTVEIACDAANNWIADFFEELSNLAYGLEDITTDNIETVLAILSTQYPNTTVSNSNVLYMYN